MFEAELQYFIKNQDALVAQHRGRTLILRGDAVVGVEDTPLMAYLAAKQRFEPGSFMIQLCVPGPEAYTVTLANA